MEILNHFKGKSGYTLLELIVVLALFAIILSIGIPSIGIIFNTQENNELRTFRRDILAARNSAVVEKAIYTINLDIDKNTYKISKTTDLTKVIKSVKLEHGIKINKNNLVKEVRFNTTGAPTNAGTIYLTNRKGQKIEITITPATGSINLYIKN